MPTTKKDFATMLRLYRELGDAFPAIEEVFDRLQALEKENERFRTVFGKIMGDNIDQAREIKAVVGIKEGE